MMITASFLIVSWLIMAVTDICRWWKYWKVHFYLPTSSWGTVVVSSSSSSSCLFSSSHRS